MSKEGWFGLGQTDQKETFFSLKVTRKFAEHDAFMDRSSQNLFHTFVYT